MPLQNRVNPEGEICFSPAYGTLMGNRGCLHDANRMLRRHSKQDAWITCSLDYKVGEKRTPMTPGRYTELFFLDEATALAAGHRPCWQCRRQRFDAFLKSWASVFPEFSGKVLEVDLRLKVERANDMRPLAPDVKSLPDGVFVQEKCSGQSYLLHGRKAYPWSFSGYGEAVRPELLVSPLRLLTPVSTVAVIRNGYHPDVHCSLTERFAV